ncbi:hypothetical protein niasHS_008016 [Heterodera schachtii]|uniref:Uncharacterized protein n=1 Tax=Heterodera schachtii TaxID=97005 RepID=A0ABD2J6U1_HETSC
MSIPQQFGVAAMVAELMRQNWETWSTFDDDDRLLRLLEHIFRLHRLALAAHHRWTGQFRRVNVQVGDFMIPVEWRHVPARIKGLLGWVNEEEARIREGNGVGILELVAIFQHPHHPSASGRKWSRQPFVRQSFVDSTRSEHHHLFARRARPRNPIL